jgi:hypothetical protein
VSRGLYYIFFSGHCFIFDQVWPVWILLVFLGEYFCVTAHASVLMSFVWVSVWFTVSFISPEEGNSFRNVA